jgi:uncharacterized protein YegL
MNALRKALAAMAMGFSLMALSLGAHAATILGFALDASGSVSTAQYNLIRSGLNAALAALPVDGSVQIVVVTYGTGVSTVVAPTVLTAASLPAIQAAITSHTKAGGGTNTAGAITSLTSLMTGSALFGVPGNRAIMNLVTDGVPNSQSAAVAAAQAAFAAGIDALSIEAIGSGVASVTALNNMAAIAFPTPVTILPINSVAIPNPVLGSFVVPISDFNSFAPVIAAKVIASVIPPPPPNGVAEPATLTLLALGLIFVAGSTRRARPLQMAVA